MVKPFGGNILADGSVGADFPELYFGQFAYQRVCDGGNVYSSLNNRAFGGRSTNSGPLRIPWVWRQIG